MVDSEHSRLRNGTSPSPARLSPAGYGRILPAILVIIVICGIVLWYFSPTIQAAINQRKLDRLVEQHRLAGEPTHVADLVPDEIPDDQNAAIELERAARLIDTETTEWEAWRYRDLNLHNPEHVELATQIARQNDQVLPLVETARRKPHVRWMLEYSSPMVEMDWKVLERQRNLGKML
jgi:hypothetical protein